VRLFSFEASSGRPLTSWVDAKGVSHRVDPKTSKTVISPIFGSADASQVVCMHVGAGGFIPRHPTVGPQLFAVVEGSGWVSGADGERVPLKSGQAAYWEPGELHESGSDNGMKAIVIQCASFDPGRTMREIRR
jgi:quercetin dioxygenase-like cupin family protein